MSINSLDEYWVPEHVQEHALGLWGKRFEICLEASADVKELV